MTLESMIIRKNNSTIAPLMEFEKFQTIYPQIIDFMTLYYQLNPDFLKISSKNTQGKARFIVTPHHKILELLTVFSAHYGIDFYQINLSKLLLTLEDGITQMGEELKKIFIQEIQLHNQDLIAKNQSDVPIEQTLVKSDDIESKKTEISEEKLEISTKSPMKLLVIPIDLYEKEFDEKPKLFLFRFFSELFSIDCNYWNIRLLFIMNDTQSVPHSFLDEFDINFIIENPTLKERKEFLHYYLLSTWIPNLDIDMQDLNTTIDFEHIARQMDNWNFGDIQVFIQYSYWIWRLELLNAESLKKKYDTTFLINLFDSFLKTQSLILNPNKNTRTLNTSDKNLPSNVDSIQNEDVIYPAYQHDLEIGLYQEIVLGSYDDLLLTLDKLNKGLILDQKDRALLADYPFVLRESPEKVMQKMQKAKTRIDRIHRLNPNKTSHK